MSFPEAPEETTERLRRDGYFAHCDAHGNQTFIYDPVSQHMICPATGCGAQVCDFRVCFVHDRGMTVEFWHAGPWA